MRIIERDLPKGAQCPKCRKLSRLVYALVPDPPIINTEPDWGCAECFLTSLIAGIDSKRIEISEVQ